MQPGRGGERGCGLALSLQRDPACRSAADPRRPGGLRAPAAQTASAESAGPPVSPGVNVRVVRVRADFALGR